MILPLRLISAAYAVVLGVVAALNYIPGMVDADGRVLGIFELDIYDDGLHLASALWAALAAMISRRAACFFLGLFGAMYLADGLMGVTFGSGYLDLAIVTFGIRDYPFTFKLLANLPHIVLGGFGLLSVVLDRRGHAS